MVAGPRNLRITSVYTVFIIKNKIMLLLNNLGNLTFPGGGIERDDWNNFPETAEELCESISFEKDLLFHTSKQRRLTALKGILREMKEEITLDDEVFNVANILKGSYMYVTGLNCKDGATCFILNKSMPEEIAELLKKRVNNRTKSDDGNLPYYLSEIKEVFIFDLNEVLRICENGRITPNNIIALDTERLSKVTNRANKLLRKLIAVDDEIRAIIQHNAEYNIERNVAYSAKPNDIKPSIITSNGVKLSSKFSCLKISDIDQC